MLPVFKVEKARPGTLQKGTTLRTCINIAVSQGYDWSNLIV